MGVILRRTVRQPGRRPVPRRTRGRPRRTRLRKNPQRTRPTRRRESECSRRHQSWCRHRTARCWTVKEQKRQVSIAQGDDEAAQATGRTTTYRSVDAFVTLRTANVASSEGFRAELVEELEVAACARACARRGKREPPGLESAAGLDSLAAALAPVVDDRLETFAAGVVGVTRAVASGRHALLGASARL